TPGSTAGSASFWSAGNVARESFTVARSSATNAGQPSAICGRPTLSYLPPINVQGSGDAIGLLVQSGCDTFIARSIAAGAPGSSPGASSFEGWRSRFARAANARLVVEGARLLRFGAAAVARRRRAQGARDAADAGLIL